jgi:hypothetical protein
MVDQSISDNLADKQIIRLNADDHKDAKNDKLIYEADVNYIELSRNIAEINTRKYNDERRKIMIPIYQNILENIKKFDNFKLQKNGDDMEYVYTYYMSICESRKYLNLCGYQKDYIYKIDDFIAGLNNLDLQCRWRWEYYFNLYFFRMTSYLIIEVYVVVS